MKSKKVYVLVSIDTECDKGSPGWDIRHPLSFKNISLQKELLMPLFKKYDIVPTFLLSPEVLTDEASVAILRSLEGVELGTHLHEEFIAPNANFNTKRTKNIQANLPVAIEKQKLENLTNLFYNTIGHKPRSFRSGRYGSSKKTTKILSDLGYLVDSSIVPYTAKYYEGHKIDSWNATTTPYYEYFKEKKILQVPVTSINPHFEKLPRFLKNEVKKNNSKIKTLFKRFGANFDARQLRPYRESGAEMINIAKHVLKNHFSKEPFVILNIMFHSNEILVNGSPYCKSETEVKEYISSLEMLFNYLQKNHDVCSIGLGDVYGIYGQN